MDFTNKKIAVVGFGVEGQATAAFLKNHGALVTICDEKAQLAETDDYESQFGLNYLDKLNDFDQIFRSPSVRPELLSRYSNVTTSTQYFLANCPAVTIGVTGTKGKGTTSTLIVKLLETIGQKVWLGGNIGTPKLSFLDNVDQSDVVVLELSSFQLIDCNASPDIAVCLMIEPDHLNWHPNMDEYIGAKANITTHQKPEDVFIYHPTNPNVQTIVAKSPADKRPYMQAPSAHIEEAQIYFQGQALMPVSQVGMIGSHNIENICAALTALEAYSASKNIDLDQYKQAIIDCMHSFKGLEHRLEFVREVDGVSYFNDSYSVMPAATIAGTVAFSQPVIAIVGGVDKKISYDDMADILTNCKYVVVVGEIASQIKAVFDNKNYTNYTVINGSMSDMVKAAKEHAKAGDVILLSPGSSSYDMFKSYKDRGEQFKQVVNSL